MEESCICYWSVAGNYCGCWGRNSQFHCITAPLFFLGWSNQMAHPRRSVKEFGAGYTQELCPLCLHRSCSFGIIVSFNVAIVYCEQLSKHPCVIRDCCNRAEWSRATHVMGESSRMLSKHLRCELFRFQMYCRTSREHILAWLRLFIAWLRVCIHITRLFVLYVFYVYVKVVCFMWRFYLKLCGFMFLSCMVPN